VFVEGYNNYYLYLKKILVSSKMFWWFVQLKNMAFPYARGYK